MSHSYPLAKTNETYLFLYLSINVLANFNRTLTLVVASKINFVHFLWGNFNFRKFPCNVKINFNKYLQNND